MHTCPCVLLRLLVLVSLLFYCAYLSMCVVEVTSIGEPTILLCILICPCVVVVTLYS